MTVSKPKKPRKPRNWLAVAARNRKGGHHGDRKKETSRRACRGRFREDGR